MIKSIGYRLAVALAVVAGVSSPGLADSVVATGNIRAGTILSAADVATDSAAVAGAAQNLDEVIGLEARRNLYAGRPVFPSHLGPPTLVKRNNRVVMLYQGPGLALRAQGRALDAGGVGEMIRVMNLKSRTSIFATVIAPDTVEVFQ